MSKWVIEGNFLKLSSENGLINPSADQVYSSVIEKKPDWPDLEAGKSGKAGELTFSRYPVSLNLKIIESDTGKLPSLYIDARTQSGGSFSVDPSALNIGHVISADTWYPIAEASIKEVARILEKCNIESFGEIPTLKALLNLKAVSSENSLIKDLTTHSTIYALNNRSDQQGKPAGIKATLYSYQTDGWRWVRFLLCEQVGGLLADEMGLGKTLQVISAIRDPGNNALLTKVLIVAPGSLLENWRREFEKFAPDLEVLKHQGSLRTGRPAELKDYDVVITSYDTVIRDLSLLNMIRWSVVILDEAQNIKNPEALRTQSVKQLKRNAGLAMTGTPVENRLTDLWSIMDFAVPGYLGDIDDFNRLFDNDVDAAEKLEPLISPLILRRRVSEVAQDLPERIDVPEIIELSEPEALEYERIRKTIYDEYGNAATLVSLTKLRQFCAHPSLTPEHEAESFPSDFTKFSRLMEILEEIFLSHEKVIVFTSYTEMADLIATTVNGKFGVFTDVLDGRLPIDNRQPLIDRFSDVIGPAVLVLNPKAGGAGLNITAATHVIHYNLEWNPALEDQASARAHRRGQTRPVVVRRLICEGTVEEVVEDRVKRKRAISDAAIVGVKGKDIEYDDLISALKRTPIRR